MLARMFHPVAPSIRAFAPPRNPKPGRAFGCSRLGAVEATRVRSAPARPSCPSTRRCLQAAATARPARRGGAPPQRRCFAQPGSRGACPRAGGGLRASPASLMKRPGEPKRGAAPCATDVGWSRLGLAVQINGLEVLFAAQTVSLGHCPRAPCTAGLEPTALGH